MRDCVVPERNGRAASDERGARELHYGSDSPFSHSTQLMHMRRTRSAMNPAARKEISEFCRYEFACIIGV
eukprot:3263699-Pleurochrysis_carterae.AAC.1